MKKFQTVFFIFVLYFNLITQANASIGGWTMSNPIANGASTVYNGTKNVLINGKNVVKKGVATVTPTATNVAKVLARGAGGLALSVAVEQLLGSVDWVLDPANNQIKYTPSGSSSEPPNTAYYFVFSTSYGKAYATDFDSIARAAANLFTKNYNGNYPQRQLSYLSHQSLTWGANETGSKSFVFTVSATSGNNPDTYSLAVSRVLNPNYNPEAQDQKTLPLDVVAQKVISNAASGDVSAQTVTKAAAADMVQEAETDNTKARPIVNQLESSAETATEETATGETTATDPTTGETTKTGDLKLSFPVFCGWAPVVCEAAQVVIKFPTTVTEWWETANTKSDSWVLSIKESWTEAKEWFTAPPQEPQKLDLPTKELTEKSFVTNLILVNGNYCPADKSIEWDTPMGHFSKTVSYQNFCDASEWFGYLVLAAAYYMGAIIVVRDS